MYKKKTSTKLGRIVAGVVLAAVMDQAAFSQPRWMDTDLSPDERATALESDMTLDEKIALLHGHYPPMMHTLPNDALWTSGYVAGVPRLGIPPLRESDAGLGVTNPFGKRNDEGSTLLPSGLAQAATWNPDLARQAGAVIGAEAHAKGFNVVLAGGLNLARDPRNGRNFEYAGEDPLLAGTMVGSEVDGIQSQYEISTLKHFALNDQETGRFVADAAVDMSAARESDLLAFEIAIERGQPGAVMCAYNQVGGTYACENPTLLHDILKQDWGFGGWVMSDWGGTHSTEVAALNGLDQEDGEELDGQSYFAQPLKDAVLAGRVPEARFEDMVHRILRMMFAKGVIDHPAEPGGAIDFAADERVSQRIAEKAIVLLKNANAVLPLARTATSIAVIGGHADKGVLAGGGGSSEVVPHGGFALRIRHPEADFEVYESYVAPSPLAAIGARAPANAVTYAAGDDIAAAVAAAKSASIAIVFATQWTSESVDAPTLSLPNHQDALIAAVANANPHTIVVLETTGPVLMPWIDNVAGILEAWTPGQEGAEAIAETLFDEINPSGRLPITFPASDAQLPRTYLPGYASMIDARKASGNAHEGPPMFAIDYYEGDEIGYRWDQARNLTPLFPFGFGQSYTTFAYSNLRVEGGATLTVSFDVTNTGPRAGADTAEVYASEDDTGAEAVRHLVGWSKVTLSPAETRHISITAEPRLMARFDTLSNSWILPGGTYKAVVGRFAGDVQLTGTAIVGDQHIKP